MNKCERCIHKPICEFVASNFEGFHFPAGDKPCILFHEETEKAVCDCAEAENTTFDHTIEMMRSPDYKKRFKAEYYQTKIRYEKLHKMLVKAEAGTLGFEPTCSLELLIVQKRHMGEYLHCLEVRAEKEHIDL